jgi:hypothetical protein
VLAIIPISYIIGLIGLSGLSGISGNATFSGRYFMNLYLGVCIIAVIHFLYMKKRTK